MVYKITCYIGIAKALKSSLISRPIFTKNWDIEEPEVLEGLWIDIKGCLEEDNLESISHFVGCLEKGIPRTLGAKGLLFNR